MSLKEKSLCYHSSPIPGKVSIRPTKPFHSVEDLSLAYTPGVAVPVLEIAANPALAYQYTNKGNCVAIISNGTAVLGLGNVGALAGKPVMEGKSILFKRFANIDAFDLEMNQADPAKLVEIIASLEPTFGGINLEDIKAPECFYVEEELKKRMTIPVFHDDQHGTAVIVGAAVLNALESVHKKIPEVKIVFSGAGAAAIAIGHFLLVLGAGKKNMFMFDSMGLITQERHDLNGYKQFFAQAAPGTFVEILRGADIFIGVSQKDIFTPAMIQSMRQPPIVLAMANPNPEISYEAAIKAVPRIIMATGRSDYPNQVNNVLCFPFMFRGALDVQASAITEGMKLAAARSLAALAHEPVPEEVVCAYGRTFSFGDDYIIPKPFDPRLLYTVSVAVAEAAMREGVARKEVDLGEYKRSLQELALKLSEKQ